MTKKIVFRDTQLDDSIRVLDLSPEDYRPEDVRTPQPKPVTMYLIYPGMSDYVTVEIVKPGDVPGTVYVRQPGNGSLRRVSISRLVDQETAEERKSTKIIERDGYTVTEHTVRGI